MKVMSLNTKTLIKDGSRKIIYQGANNDRIILSFKDVTPFIKYSGILWNLISEQFFQVLNSCNVKTHFLKRINLREQEVYNASSYPFYIRVTNIIADDYHQMFGLEAGTVLKQPLVEFVRKTDLYIIDQHYLELFEWCKTSDLIKLKDIAIRVNDLFRAFLFGSKMQISHIYLSFGLFQPEFTFLDNPNENILVIDDFTPYNIVFWDQTNHHVIEFNQELSYALASFLKIDMSRWSEKSTKKDDELILDHD